jgi:hypothetical protein
MSLRLRCLVLGHRDVLARHPALRSLLILQCSRCGRPARKVSR